MSVAINMIENPFDILIGEVFEKSPQALFFHAIVLSHPGQRTMMASVPNHRGNIQH